MLHLGVDLPEVDLDKVVVEGQLVDPPREEDQEHQGFPLNWQELQVEHGDPLVEAQGPELEQPYLRLKNFRS